MAKSKSIIGAFKRGYQKGKKTPIKKGKSTGMGGALGAALALIPGYELGTALAEPFAAWNQPTPDEEAERINKSASKGWRNVSSISAAPAKPQASVKLWGAPTDYSNYSRPKYSFPQPKEEPLPDMAPMPSAADYTPLTMHGESPVSAHQSTKGDIFLPNESKPKPKAKKGKSILKPSGEFMGGGDFTMPAIQGDIPELPPLESRDLPSNAITGDRSEIGTEPIEPSVFDTYFNTWKNRPEEKDYKPSIGRRIIGALGGLSEGWGGGAAKGLATSTNFVRQPYERAEEEWGSKLDELEPLMKQEVYKQINDDRIAETRRKNDLINQTKNTENEIDRMWKEGKIKNEADAVRAKELVDEARLWLANGQLELGWARLEQAMKIANVNAGLRGRQVTAQEADVKSKVKYRESQSMLNDIANKFMQGMK